MSDSPIKFISLTVKNFMSYGQNETTISLDFNHPTLIIGKNYDAIVNGQIDSNGAGKSTLLDALSFALYDKTISRKAKPTLINNVNKKDMVVVLEFSKNSVMYRITRSMKSKTKSDVMFERKSGDEWVDKTPDSISNTNNLIIELIKLPFEIFSRIIVFSATFEPFLDLPSRHASKPNQTDIMEELFGYTELSEKAEVLKANIKHTNNDIDIIKQVQAQLGVERDRHTNFLRLANDRVALWSTTHAENITLSAAQVSKFDDIDFDAERTNLTRVADIKSVSIELVADLRVISTTLTAKSTERDNYTSAADALVKHKETVADIASKIDFDAEQEMIDNAVVVNATIDKLRNSISTLESNISDADSNIVKINSELSQLEKNTCPYCSQEYKDVVTKIDELTDNKSALTTVADAVRIKLVAKKEKLITVKEILSNYRDTSKTGLSQLTLTGYKSKYDKSKAIVDASGDVADFDFSACNSEITTLTENGDEIRADLKKLDAELDDITCLFTDAASLESKFASRGSLIEKLETLKSDANPHIDALTELGLVEFEEVDSDKLNVAVIKLEHQEFLLKLLTKKDSFIRKNLLDRSLPFLNTRLKAYLDKLGLPHTVSFKPDMTASISQFGTQLPFSSMSSGQKARVNLALAFAFRDVLQSRYGKISFCMLDECLDTGLGNVGVQLAATMIKEIAEEDDMSMFIISHRDEISAMFKEQLVVELRNGFSTIV